MRIHVAAWTCVALSVAAACLGRQAASGDEATWNAAVEKCRADLAAKAQVGTADVKVVSVEEVTWPDGSLGHPEPGKDYTMALVPGYRVVLRVGDKQREYHTDRSAQKIIDCGEPTAGPKQGGATTPPPVTGPVAPPARLLLWYLVDLPDDANGNRRLVAREAGAAPDSAQTILDRCVDFVVSSSGGVLAKRRTSRSTHELVLAVPGAQPVVVMQGFDFEGLTWLEPGNNYLFLAATAGPGSTFRMYGGDVTRQPAALDWAPELKRAHGAVVSAHWNLLVVAVPAGGDTSQVDVTVMDLYKRHVVETFRTAKSALAVLMAPPPVVTTGGK